MKFASRKFIIAASLIAITTVLAFAGVMDGGNVSSVFVVVGGGYGLANVMDKR